VVTICTAGFEAKYSVLRLHSSGYFCDTSDNHNRHYYFPTQLSNSSTVFFVRQTLKFLHAVKVNFSLQTG